MNIIRTAVLALVISLGLVTSPAQSAQPPAKCRTLSEVTQVQTRDVSGVVLSVTYPRGGRAFRTLGAGIQERTVTTTVAKCRGKATTTTTTSPWAGGSTVRQYL